MKCKFSTRTLENGNFTSVSMSSMFLIPGSTKNIGEWELKRHDSVKCFIPLLRSTKTLGVGIQRK